MMAPDAMPMRTAALGDELDRLVLGGRDRRDCGACRVGGKRCESEQGGKCGKAGDD